MKTSELLKANQTISNDLDAAAAAGNHAEMRRLLKERRVLRQNLEAARTEAEPQAGRQS